jgi:hypothetical protein
MRAFDQRWIRRSECDANTLLGTADIQSLADLDNAYSIIKEMNPVPFSRDMIMQLLWATLVPFFPLIFTLIPLEELLDRIFKSVF